MEGAQEGSELKPPAKESEGGAESEKSNGQAKASAATEIHSVGDPSASAAKPADAQNPREVSAATIGRMMGLATNVEIKLLEGKLDLMSTRVNNFAVRMDKVMNLLGAMPTGTDLERIDVQIGALRTMIRDALAGLAQGAPSSAASGEDSESEQKAKRSSRIQSNKPAEESSEESSEENSE